MTRGRDVSLRYEGGHSPETHTVVLEWYWKPPTDRSGNEPLRPVLTVSRTRCCKLHDGGARASSTSQRSRRAQCRVVVLEVQARHSGNCNLPQSVPGEDQRQSHCQEASGENPRQNHSQRPCGEKKRQKQHGYEDSEKNSGSEALNRREREKQ